MEVSNITKRRIVDYLKEKKRFDNRGLLDYRKIEIELGVVKKAEGSARVKIGNTEVIAGVKIDITEPFANSEDEGIFITGIELLPLSSDKFEPGPPSIKAVELARIVDRGIRESGYIDFKKMIIKEGEKVWGIWLDIYSINNDGNLLDACCLAGIAALKDAKLPKYDEKKEKVVYGELTAKKLPLTKLIPLTMTFFKIGNDFILDPICEEEEASDGRISIAMSSNKDKIMINALQKGESFSISKEDVFEVLDIAEKKYKELKEKVLKNLED